MASLGNILKREGGTPLTGRPVKFQLIAKNSQGEKRVHAVDAILHPVGEEDRMQAIDNARTFCEEQKTPTRYPVESDLRFFRAALRDAESPTRPLATTDEELAHLRAGLTYDQVKWLQGEYQALLESEFPELRASVVTQEDAAGMKGQARDFSVGGQPELGKSSP